MDLAYMTGILPIKKYGEHSVVDVFDEITEEVYIPNQEIAQEFLNAVDHPAWDGVIQSIRCSMDILLVGINYDDEREHECIIERFTKIN